MTLDSFPDFSAIAWPRVMTELTATGFAVVEDALPSGCWEALRAEAEHLLGAWAFVEGRIGPGGDQRQDLAIRSDSLCWLDRDMPAGGRYLRWMDELRVALNRQLYLGLTAFEAHYAHFPIGAFYGSHLDRYRDSNARVLSAVFYCNQDWPVGAGGEFVMYDDQDATCLTLVPRGGTLLLFLSAGARHEAKVASRARWSIAGWFRTGA
ncbi:MAG TPA: 2OG-Fe(II) oxygenase [Polyangia bacterium]